jgi:hypothetical protein
VKDSFKNQIQSWLDELEQAFLNYKNTDNPLTKFVFNTAVTKAISIYNEIPPQKIYEPKNPACFSADDIPPRYSWLEGVSDDQATQTMIEKYDFKKLFAWWTKKINSGSWENNGDIAIDYSKLYCIKCNNCSYTYDYYGSIDGATCTSYSIIQRPSSYTTYHELIKQRLKHYTGPDSLEKYYSDIGFSIPVFKSTHATGS